MEQELADEIVEVPPEEFEPVTLEESTETPEAPESEEDGPTIEDLAKEALGEAEADVEEEDVEIEWEGRKVRVPQSMKDANLRHSDYTRKTMDLSEQKKSFQKESEAFGQSAAQIASNLQAVVNLSSVNNEIKRLSAMDTSGWSQAQIQQGTNKLHQLQQQAGQINTALQQKAQQTQEAESQQMASLRQKAMDEAAAKIPNFTDKRRQELEQFAISAGVDQETVDTLTESWAFEMLHLADIGKKFIERQSKASTMKSANVGTPARTVSGKSGGTKAVEDMSFEEFAAYREAGGT